MKEKNEVKEFLLNENNIVDVRFFDIEASHYTFEVFKSTSPKMHDSLAFLKQSKERTRFEISSDGSHIIADLAIQDDIENQVLVYLSIFYNQNDYLDQNYLIEKEFDRLNMRTEYFDFIEQLDLEGIAVLGEL